MVIPRQLVLEVSSCCNLHCIGCPINSDSSSGFMDFDFFKSCIDRINFPATVVAWLNGEPLMHPRYGEMVDYMIRKNQRFYTTTNGHFWRDDFFRRVTDPDSTCYQVLFSLDGLPLEESRSIEAARPGSNRAKVLSTIERFIELKRSKNASLDIAVKICERGQDYEEFERYISYWLNQGVDYVCVGRFLENDHVDPAFRLHRCQYFDNFSFEIRWDGRMVPCSYNAHAMNEDALHLGVLDFTMPLLEAYNNEAFTALRKAHHEGTFPYPCNTCGFAYTGMGLEGVVKFRDKLLGERPIYYHSDYYNSFYSYREKRSGTSWGVESFKKEIK